MEIRVACVDVARDPRFDPVLMQIACLAQLYPKTKDPGKGARLSGTRARDETSAVDLRIAGSEYLRH